MGTESRLERILRSPLLFTLLTALLAFLYTWPKRWLISGAPLLTILLLAGEAKGHRILPSIHLWPIFTTLHLGYAICSTSWLLFWVFTAFAYPTAFLVSLFQFEPVGDVARRSLRRILKDLQFIDDKIAFFDIPALEIDTEVDGLMVLRGITFSLSSLSFVVHGVEVGIKLSDDMELSIQTEEVKVKLFRGIEVGDCFANLKGGEYEMTFGSLEGHTRDVDGDAVFVEATPLLKAASIYGDRRSLDESRSATPNGYGDAFEAKEVKMTEAMTDGKTLEDAGAKEGLESMKKMSPDNEVASGRYQRTVTFIKETNAIYEARKTVKSLSKKKSVDERTFDHEDDNALRAAICSQLHPEPSVPHPPQKSIKVTTLQNLMPAYIRRFTHRLPMLLRLLLNPLSYFHPVKISSITAAASGRWIDSILIEKIFKSYWETDSEIRSLKNRISAWLSDSNFVIELGPIIGLAQVPFIPTYDINCHLSFSDVMAYRALPKDIDLKQVVRLGGADATFILPSFLLPHHEHLLPPVPTKEAKQDLEKDIEDADGVPKEVQAQHDLEQAQKDETNVKIAVHARLPACFDQELLDFIAALVKATKVVEMEKEPSVMDEEVHGIREFSRALKGGLKEGVKKVVVDGVVNESVAFQPHSYPSQFPTRTA
ncbi:uncharacterized protein LY89DRAFT_694187 [Mollisia scopiformis]|uniref:Uncharacterized protein n=1 Tax=Mollisia scopiformis TaxID=149040 RepID=A0A194XN99_MOLSC|nr:uncharacterized protein LY89DRAFT_694187 [Mollisia scopiformis]KUJ21648.1 hypothetical protein LY89DRAFT_694187 [Mollisia scopiformis]